jgi:hypothetical protein
VCAAFAHSCAALVHQMPRSSSSRPPCPQWLAGLDAQRSPPCLGITATSTGAAPTYGFTHSGSLFACAPLAHHAQPSLLPPNPLLCVIPHASPNRHPTCCNTFSPTLPHTSSGLSVSTSPHAHAPTHAILALPTHPISPSAACMHHYMQGQGSYPRSSIASSPVPLTSLPVNALAGVPTFPECCPISTVNAARSWRGCSMRWTWRRACGGNWWCRSLQRGLVP